MAVKSLQKLRVIERERLNRAAILVYNGAEEDQSFKLGAHPFVLKPGINEITDVYGTPRDIAVKMRKDGKFGADGHVAPKTELIHSALDIAAQAESRLGARGVFAMSGDDKADAEAKRQARGQWIRAKAVDLRDVMDRYRRRTVAFVSDPRNVGAAAPLMTDTEIAAETWLARYETGALTVKKLVCPFKDGFHTDDKAAMDVHMEARHSKEAQAEIPAPKNKGGRPKNATAEASS